MHSPLSLPAIRLGTSFDRCLCSCAHSGDSNIGEMDAEGSMEQNGDRNDAGTVSHYPDNYYVNSRLLDTGR
jgi:hypothetical protein